MSVTERDQAGGSFGSGTPGMSVAIIGAIAIAGASILTTIEYGIAGLAVCLGLCGVGMVNLGFTKGLTWTLRKEIRERHSSHSN